MNCVSISRNFSDIFNLKSFIFMFRKDKVIDGLKNLKILRTFNRKSGNFLMNVYFVTIVTAGSAFIPSIMFGVNGRYL